MTQCALFIMHFERKFVTLRTIEKVNIIIEAILKVVNLKFKYTKQFYIPPILD